MNIYVRNCLSNTSFFSFTRLSFGVRDIAFLIPQSPEIDSSRFSRNRFRVGKNIILHCGCAMGIVAEHIQIQTELSVK